ncbi:MAG: GNAT family N-acetyltransferase [Candidatus Bathyarchaeia archaeon]
MSITIQRATVNDLEVLYSIEMECFTIEAFSKRHIAYLLENPNTVSLVARVNNEIAGFVIGVIQRQDKTITGHIYTIDVATKHRRRGVGLRLLNELERIFEKGGVKICYLEARVDNVAARELYRKQGYVEVEKLRDYYCGAHGVRLKKKLGI